MMSLKDSVALFRVTTIGQQMRDSKNIGGSQAYVMFYFLNFTQACIDNKSLVFVFSTMPDFNDHNEIKIMQTLQCRLVMASRSILKVIRVGEI